MGEGLEMDREQEKADFTGAVSGMEQGYDKRASAEEALEMGPSQGQGPQMDVHAREVLEKEEAF
ncbi:MAG TPA: hypothetical protein VLK23_13490 [Thermodesulfobacteriota bacterium]|nr:hypothetical protein [Thermodesulfobacteriota bacterium]